MSTSPNLEDEARHRRFIQAEQQALEERRLRKEAWDRESDRLQRQREHDARIRQFEDIREREDDRRRAYERQQLEESRRQAEAREVEAISQRNRELEQIRVQDEERRRQAEADRERNRRIERASRR